MATTPLERELKARLESVLAFAGTDAKLIREGIRRALRGVKDHRRYKFLCDELTRRATNAVEGTAEVISLASYREKSK